LIDLIIAKIANFAKIAELAEIVSLAEIGHEMGS